MYLLPGGALRAVRPGRPEQNTVARDRTVACLQAAVLPPQRPANVLTFQAAPTYVQISATIHVQAKSAGSLCFLRSNYGGKSCPCNILRDLRELLSFPLTS